MAGLERSRIASINLAACEFVVWVLKHADDDAMAAMAKPAFDRVIGSLSMMDPSDSGPAMQLRGFLYQAVGELAQVCPETSSHATMSSGRGVGELRDGRVCPLFMCLIPVSRAFAIRCFVTWPSCDESWHFTTVPRLITQQYFCDIAHVSWVRALAPCVRSRRATQTRTREPEISCAAFWDVG